MAIREIRKTPDEVLYKKSREVTDFDERLHTLLDDMRETLERLKLAIDEYLDNM